MHTIGVFLGAKQSCTHLALCNFPKACLTHGLGCMHCRLKRRCCSGCMRALPLVPWIPLACLLLVAGALITWWVVLVQLMGGEGRHEAIRRGVATLASAAVNATRIVRPRPKQMADRNRSCVTSCVTVAA